MTYHTVLKTSDDFISALRWARRLADNASAVMEWDVFPYSVFYVFYEQYLTTVHDMALNLGLSIGMVVCYTVGKKDRTVYIHLSFLPFSCCVLCHYPDVWSEHLGGFHPHVGCLYDHSSHVWLHAPPWDQRQCHFSCQPCHGEHIDDLAHTVLIRILRMIQFNEVNLHSGNFIMFANAKTDDLYQKLHDS